MIIRPLEQPLLTSGGGQLAFGIPQVIGKHHAAKRKPARHTLVPYLEGQRQIRKREAAGRLGVQHSGGSNKVLPSRLAL